MTVEGRGWVTRVGIELVNWQQEEPAGLGRRRQPSGGDTSRMSREAQVRICERLGVQLPGPTRRAVRATQALTAHWAVKVANHSPTSWENGIGLASPFLRGWDQRGADPHFH